MITQFTKVAVHSVLVAPSVASVRNFRPSWCRYIPSRSATSTECTATLRRPGLSLLEVILALSLTVIILGMLGGYMGMHARMTETAKRNVGTTELADAIMSLIVEDIRGVQVDYRVVTQHDEALEIPTEEEEEPEEEDVEEEPTEEELALQVLPFGLYGNNTFLRIDTAKTRRPGRRWATTESLASGTNTMEIGELRTISYGMDLPTSAEQIAGLVPIGQDVDMSLPVLLRSSRDRAVSNFFVANLGGDDEQLFAQPLANEVASIQFRYFDGTQWLAEWDTLQFGGLPLAVEVMLVMNPTPEEFELGMDPVVLESDLTFRRTVQVPAARPLLQEAAL